MCIPGFFSCIKRVFRKKPKCKKSKCKNQSPRHGRLSETVQQWESPSPPGPSVRPYTPPANPQIFNYRATGRCPIPRGPAPFEQRPSQIRQKELWLELAREQMDQSATSSYTGSLIGSWAGWAPVSTSSEASLPGSWVD